MSPLSVLQAEHMTLDTKPSTLCGRTKNSASAINVIMFRNQGLHNIPYIYWHLKLGFSLAPQHLALLCIGIRLRLDTLHWRPTTVALYAAWQAALFILEHLSTKFPSSAEDSQE